MSNAVAVPCLGIVSMARRPSQTSKTKPIKIPPPSMTTTASVGFGTKRREQTWQCKEGCGACFATPEEIFNNPTDTELSSSMVGEDGWCVNFDKGTSKCLICNGFVDDHKVRKESSRIEQIKLFNI